MTLDHLIAAARHGDPDAFLALLAPHEARVWRVVRTVARRQSDAEDLAQDVYVKAFQAFPRYQGDGALIGAWLVRIAVNTAHDWQRSGWIRRVLHPGEEHLPEVIAPESDPAVLAEQSEQRRQVLRAVLRLPEAQRVPIHLVYFEGYTIADAARLERVPETTLRSRVTAGLKALARTLGATWDEPYLSGEKENSLG